jgi:hypothetical protein
MPACRARRSTRCWGSFGYGSWLTSADCDSVIEVKERARSFRRMSRPIANGASIRVKAVCPKSLKVSVAVWCPKVSEAPPAIAPVWTTHMPRPSPLALRAKACPACAPNIIPISTVATFVTRTVTRFVSAAMRLHSRSASRRLFPIFGCDDRNWPCRCGERTIRPAERRCLSLRMELDRSDAR